MSMDLVLLGATSLGATRPPPESGEAAGGGKRLKSEPETPDWESMTHPWESKRLDDLEESDFSMYDDYPVPYFFRHKGFVYKNKAAIKQDEAIAEFRERCGNLSPYDAVAPPPNSGLLGGVRPFPATDDDYYRPLLIRFCNLALEKYNADNQGANFVFEDLVKSTRATVSGYVYYITFKAKDPSTTNNTAAVRTFQAKVYDKLRPKDAEPEVKSCSMKPT